MPLNQSNIKIQKPDVGTTKRTNTDLFSSNKTDSLRKESTERISQFPRTITNSAKQ